MIKILKADYLYDRVIRLEFSDGTQGDYDLQPLIEKDTEMVKPLADEAFFRQFFLELGALCWPNGFDLSAQGIQLRLKERNKLQSIGKAA